MTREALNNTPKANFLLGPSPIHPLPRLTKFLGGDVGVWAKREDLNSGMAYGGNKTRKLEYLAQDALNQGCDTLVPTGGVQSDHTSIRRNSFQRVAGVHLFRVWVTNNSHVGNNAVCQITI